MTWISKQFKEYKTAYGRLTRLKKAAAVSISCFATAGFALLITPLVKPLIVLSLLSGTSEKLWNSLYCRPCGNCGGIDFGLYTIATLCWCGEPEKAMVILAAVLKKVHTKDNWPLVSYQLRKIDKEGKISAARWFELCRPFAEYQRLIFASQHRGMVLDNWSYQKNATYSLIEGYETHGLLSECEGWLKKLVNKEAELYGTESLKARFAMIKLVQFYEKHDKSGEAAVVIEQLRKMETHQDRFGDRWRFVRTASGSYELERMEAANSGI